MPRPHPSPEPDPDTEAFWPSCDDQPPGVLIRPLSHADLPALLAHLQYHDLPPGPAPGRPVVAVRVRASVGRPGASAAAEYRRRRATERAAWRATVPWRVAAVLAVGMATGLLAATLLPGRGGLAGMVAAAGLAWLLRFRPGGVVVIDSKQYQGRLQLDPDGLLWHGRHLLVSALRKVRWAADQADEVLGVADLTVAAIVAVHGSSVPWGRLEADGVTVAPARRVPDLLRALPPMLGPERVAWLADRARLRFRAAA
jgi:hypothetical protein